jgi:hypothetical protein
MDTRLSSVLNDFIREALQAAIDATPAYNYDRYRSNDGRHFKDYFQQWVNMSGLDYVIHSVEFDEETCTFTVDYDEVGFDHLPKEPWEDLHGY